MKHFESFNNLLITCALTDRFKVQRSPESFIPLLFLRTGEEKVEVLFKFQIALLIPANGDDESDKGISVDRKMYDVVKSSFSVDKIQDGFLESKGIISWDDCETSRPIILHDHSSSKDTCVVTPSNPYGFYRLLETCSYVVFTLHYDQSMWVNKMVMTDQDKYLGRQTMSHEERTNLLLQDKEA